MAHSETILGSSIDKKNRQVKSPAIDLSFLRAETEQVGESSYIFNAHASIVIHGTDHFKYTGYSFLFQGLVPYDVELIDETEGEMSDAEDDEELLAIEPLIDHFVTHRCAPTLLASESPADPRELFLEAVHHRCNIIAKEYTHVVVQVEKRVKAWVSRHPTSSLGSS